ncbi:MULTISPECIES: efflux transporter outer membrane subunit [unclassified Sphingobium]|uniref:efflux transporter outer membrane subunit n=1 Tax=unclassified Sphingobium TaxID=2611147 RepID=UPI0019181BC4|nr:MULTISPECIES: TolC family protein [unclassified Sphingobium]CAD7340001.1 Outer membrane protein OprM [Sphingobium sp. S6]CAD7340423.1 Outer membrane protein OprM [Sphingobium sp. S8]
MPHLPGSRPLSLFLGVLLCGCAPSVKLARPNISLPERYEAAPSAVADEKLDRWWERFSDPQLSALVEQALAQNTDARSAYFRLREARAIRDQSLSQRLPTGAISGSAQLQNGRQLSGVDLFGSTAQSDSQSLAFSPSWEIDLFGRLGAIGEGARATYVAAAYDYHAARLSLAADVASALFEARGLAVQRDDAQEGLRIARDLARASKLGRDRGLIAASETARLEGDEATAQAELTRIETALRNAKRSLLVLIGSPDAPTSSLAIDARLDAPPQVPALMPAMLLARRPDILAAEARVAAATSAVKVDRLALFPRFTLQGNGNISRTAGPAVGISSIWSIAAGLSLPVLDRTRLMAQLRATQAQGERAVVSYEAAVQAGFRDADIALALVAADRARLADLSRAEERARFAFDAGRKGFAAGLTDLTTLVQSEQTWRAARRALTNARTQALTNVVGAFRALGGGWNPDDPATAPEQPAVALPIQSKELP